MYSPFLCLIVFVTLTHYNSFIEQTTEIALKQEGESCGDCMCPPTFTAGDCAPGLECKHDPMIADAAGRCIRPGIDWC